MGGVHEQQFGGEAAIEFTFVYMIYNVTEYISLFIERPENRLLSLATAGGKRAKSVKKFYPNVNLS